VTHSGCSCPLTTPCNPRCTCVHPESSYGCQRCASYGSKDQRRKKAEQLAEKIDGKVVRVGVAAIIRREGRLLMGRRKGAHGAGSWSFPGGHLEWNETVGKCASRETAEETGLIIAPTSFKQLTFTNDIFSVDDKHYITLYMESAWYGGEARVMEPNKCEEWGWFSSPPEPLFLPVQNLLDTGFNLWGWNYDGNH
jgi:8-oxo-dGTP diphosphatase